MLPAGVPLGRKDEGKGMGWWKTVGGDTAGMRHGGMGKRLGA